MSPLLSEPDPRPHQVLFGLLVVNDVVAETKAQVAACVNPRLIDLLAWRPEWSARSSWSGGTSPTRRRASRSGTVVVRFEGAPPLPATDSLRQALIARGVDPGDVRVELVPRATIDRSG